MYSELHDLIEVAIMMAQELQDFVDTAIESSGDGDALLSTQELIEDWERAYRAFEGG